MQIVWNACVALCGKTGNLGEVVDKEDAGNDGLVNTCITSPLHEREVVLVIKEKLGNSGCGTC